MGYFVFNLPLGSTAVVGGMGREDAAEESFGGLLSFFGFLAILLLRCSPLGMLAPDDELNVTQPKVCGCCLLEASFVLGFLDSCASVAARHRTP
jgi:hypothetical protein